MIDFSQYPEVPPFIIPEKSLRDPGQPASDFNESLFEEKRERYLHELKASRDNLLRYIERACTAFSSQADGTLKSDHAADYVIAKGWLELLINDSPETYFQREQPRTYSANCLGTDYVYNFYRSLPDYISRAKGLYTYEEYFVEMFYDTFTVTDQIFFQIGSRGKLYGYMDQKVSNFCDYMDNMADLLAALGGDWVDLIEMVADLAPDYSTEFNAWKTDIITAATDMRSIVEPVVTYINTLELASEIVNTCWGTLNLVDDINITLDEYSKNAYSFDRDYKIKTQGITNQINSQMLTTLKDDKSNFELVITKSIKISMDDIEIRQTLIDTHQNYIFPNYNP